MSVQNLNSKSNQTRCVRLPPCKPPPFPGKSVLKCSVGSQLEPQFSAKVQELMRLEEAAGKKSQFDRQVKLTEKTDTLVRCLQTVHGLLSETDYYFACIL